MDSALPVRERRATDPAAGAAQSPRGGPRARGRGAGQRAVRRRLLASVPTSWDSLYNAAAMKRRAALAILLAVVLFGSLTLTGGYACSLRSEAYRRACVALLSAALDLPCDIASVAPRSWRAREFRDVVVWLPQRRDVALRCRQATVIRRPAADNPAAYEIELTGGESEVSTRTWMRGDYRGVIESGLRPGFSAGGPRRVTFSDMNLTIVRDRLRFDLAAAAGRIDFEPQRGVATAICRALNGHAVDEPVSLSAEFSPIDGGIRIDRADLAIPEIPLSVARLGELIDVSIRRGVFGGRVRYAESDGHSDLTVSGRCAGLDLSECSAPWTPHQLHGTCPEIELKNLRITDGAVCELDFRGSLADIAVGDILALWNIHDVGGRLELAVAAAQLSTSGVERFVASGECVGLTLEPLTAAIGLGRASGALRVAIREIRIEQNRLAAFQAEVSVDDGAAPNWVEGRVIRELARRALGLNLPPILPQRFEYARLGLRLEVVDERLYVFGTHGPDDKTILTAKLFDQELSLIQEPRRSFDLTPWLDIARDRMNEWLQSQR